MVTNGVLLSEKFIKLFVSNKNMKVLSISIDDIGNNSREFKGSQWEKLVERINFFNEMKLKKHPNLSLDIKVVIMDSKIIIRFFFIIIYLYFLF